MSVCAAAEAGRGVRRGFPQGGLSTPGSPSPLATLGQLMGRYKCDEPLIQLGLITEGSPYVWASRIHSSPQKSMRLSHGGLRRVCRSLPENSRTQGPVSRSPGDHGLLQHKPQGFFLEANLTPPAVHSLEPRLTPQALEPNGLGSDSKAVAS